MTGAWAPVPAPRLAADDAVWPTADLMTLDEIRAAWGQQYDIGYADGAFYSYRLPGGPLLAAHTPEGLESAIRADWTRRGRP